MKDFKLSPTAERLLAAMEAREAAARAKKETPDSGEKQEPKKSLADCTLGPNPLDTLVGAKR